jgi:hypothetical protein
MESDPFAGVLGAGRGLQGEQARQRNHEQDERERLARSRADAAARVLAQRQTLAATASTLSYSGSDAELFWHEERGQLSWLMAAAEGAGVGTSSAWEIEQAFAALDFVNIIETHQPGSPHDCGDHFSEIEEGELAGGWYRVRHHAKIVEVPSARWDKYDPEFEAVAADADDELGRSVWRTGVGSSRLEHEYGSTWVRRGHETDYQEYLAAEAKA